MKKLMLLVAVALCVSGCKLGSGGSGNSGSASGVSTHELRVVEQTVRYEGNNDNIYEDNQTQSDPRVIPEPSTLGMLTLALAGLATSRIIRKK